MLGLHALWKREGIANADVVAQHGLACVCQGASVAEPPSGQRAFEGPPADVAVGAQDVASLARPRHAHGIEGLEHQPEPAGSTLGELMQWGVLCFAFGRIGFADDDLDGSLAARAAAAQGDAAAQDDPEITNE